MTPIRDPILQPPFRDSLSRLPSRESCSQPHSRLSFVTPDRAPNRDSLFLSRLLSCDSTTDGRTVLTPQRHLPSVPTLTLLIKNFFGTYSLAWPPPLATNHHHVHPPPPQVALCPLTRLLAPPPPPSRGLYTSCQAPFQHPYLYHTP